MSSVDNRVYERAPANFKVNFIHRGNYFISCSRDVSIDGMFICTKKTLQVGEHLHLVFSSDDNHDIEIPAIVIWARSDSQRPEKNGIGVQFLSVLPASLRKEIAQVVKRLTMLGRSMGTA